jgi:mono/diheme cytochrome c family protein
MALALAAPAFAQTGAPPTGQKLGQQLGQPLAQRSPAKTYGSTCGYCHGTNVGPIILGRHLPATYIRDMVRGGRNGMPAFRPSEITPAELDALADWISKAPGSPTERGQ